MAAFLRLSAEPLPNKTIKQANNHSGSSASHLMEMLMLVDFMLVILICIIKDNMCKEACFQPNSPTEGAIFMLLGTFRKITPYHWVDETLWYVGP